MIGEQYWATGIILRPTTRYFPIYGNKVQWAATVKFFDDGFCQDESTEGELKTRYFGDDLAKAIDTVRQDASKLNIRFERVGLPAFLSIEGDGESKDWSPPPGWRELLRAQAARIGFDTYQSEQAEVELQEAA